MAYNIFERWPFTSFQNLNLDWLITAMKEAVEKSTNAEETAENLKQFVNTYFDNLNVQQEINNKIDAMVASGEFLDTFDQLIPGIITAWLDENITPTTPAVDASLTISGAAADAKVTGDNITEIHDELAAGELDITYVQKGWQNGTGFVDQNSAMSAGEVLYSGRNGVTIETDFSRYRISLYFFTSPTNKYPHFEGNYYAPVTVQPNQYFAFFIVYQSGLVTLTDEDIDRIPRVTKCYKNIGIWDAIRAAADEMHPKVIIPYNQTIKDFPVQTGIQDAFVNTENNIMYQFTSAATEESGYAGHILRINMNTLELVDNVFHRLGHAACLGYVQKKDTLFMGRVVNSIPIIQIYKDFCASAVENAVISPSDANCKNINLTSAVLQGKTTFDVAMGEHDNILFGFCTTSVEYQNVVLVYKILLGMGSTNLSSDTNGYGTFVESADDEYNGTCKIIGEWELPAINRIPQLIKLINGSLYMVTGVRDTVIYKYRYIDGQFAVDELITINDFDADGNIEVMEPEGLIHYNNSFYLTLWDNSTPTKMRLLSADI